MKRSTKSLIAATAATLLPLMTMPIAMSQPLITQLMPPSVVFPPQAPKPAAIPAPAHVPMPAADERTVEARILLQLGTGAEQDGKLLDAIGIYNQVLAVSQRMGRPNIDAAIAAGRLGALYADLRQMPKAIKSAHIALAEFEKVEGPINNDVAIELNNLAWMYEQVGQMKQAEASYKQGLSVLRASKDEDDDLIGITENNYADLLMSQHRVKEAYPHYQKAFANLSDFFGSDHPLAKMAGHKLEKAKRQMTRTAATKHHKV